jgi:formate-dependent nitrite reductase cytochrome c552 subunit
MKLNNRMETVAFIIKLGTYKEYAEPQRTSLINELAYDLERAAVGVVLPYPFKASYNQERGKFLVIDSLNPKRTAAVDPFFPAKVI